MQCKAKKESKLKKAKKEKTLKTAVHICGSIKFLSHNKPTTSATTYNNFKRIDSTLTGPDPLSS